MITLSSVCLYNEWNEKKKMLILFLFLGVSPASLFVKEIHLEEILVKNLIWDILILSLWNWTDLCFINF